MPMVKTFYLPLPAQYQATLPNIGWILVVSGNIEKKKHSINMRTPVFDKDFTRVRLKTGLKLSIF